MTGCGGRTNLS